jgi:hypothetical protein
VPLPLPTIEITAKTPQSGLGLLTAVPPQDLTDSHVQTAGGQFEAEAATAARLYPTACRDVAYDAITYDPREALSVIYAFNVYASEICTPVGTSEAEAYARVNRRLALGEQAAVEQALWGGNGSNVVGIFQQLNTAGKVTSVGTTPGVVEGLALVEQGLKAAYDGPTYVHARPMMAPFFGNRQVYLDDQLTPRGHLQSHNRSTFVFGNGYAGSSPDNATAPSTTVETIFATGRVFIWRTDVVSPKGGTHSFVDPGPATATVNQRRIFAMRTYAIGIEGPVFAAPITRAN